MFIRYWQSVDNNIWVLFWRGVIWRTTFPNMATLVFPIFNTSPTQFIMFQRTDTHTMWVMPMISRAQWSMAVMTPRMGSFSSRHVGITNCNTQW